jgi:hypothetical protein
MLKFSALEAVGDSGFEMEQPGRRLNFDLLMFGVAPGKMFFCAV